MKSVFLDVFTKAYENDELYELFSKNEKYIFDENGRLVLAPDVKLYPDEDLVIYYGGLIISGAVYYLFKLNKKEEIVFKKRFCSAVLKMIDSDSIEQLYDATQIYYILVEHEEANARFCLRDYSVIFKEKLREEIACNKEELKQYVIGPEDCRIDGYSRIMDKEKRIKNPEKYSLIKGE